MFSVVGVSPLVFSSAMDTWYKKLGSGRYPARMRLHITLVDIDWRLRTTFFFFRRSIMTTYLITIDVYLLHET